MFVVLGFATVSVICYRRKKIQEIKQKKIEEDAKRYFVTICHRLITTFGDETTSSDYYTFRIIADNFFVMRIINQHTLQAESYIVMSVKFKGSTLVDQKTSKNYSYGGFERYLTRFIGDSLVHDSYVRYLWKQIDKSTKTK